MMTPKAWETRVKSSKSHFYLMSYMYMYQSREIISYHEISNYVSTNLVHSIAHACLTALG